MKRLLVIASLLPAIIVGCATRLPEGVIYPSITLDESVAYDIPVSVTFTFEGQPVTISVSVDGALYEGADAAEKTVTRFGNARENDWIEDYFPAFVEEEHLLPFYDSLLAELRAVRAARGLDDDRYAELLTVFAQSITYRTDPVDLEPKFPVETFVDGAGDCDDKTLLLAGLLAREGYDVAILLFEPERHVALGIACEDLDYQDTGYAYTETTAQGFIGMVPEEFADGVELESEPRVFAIGSGKRKYTAGDQVSAILEGRERALAQAAALADEIAIADETLRDLEAQVQVERGELNRLQAAGAADAYNRLVPQYNALVDRYNRATEHRNVLAQRHNELATIERIVVEGLTNRVGTFSVVRGKAG